MRQLQAEMLHSIQARADVDFVELLTVSFRHRSECISKTPRIRQDQLTSFIGTSVPRIWLTSRTTW